MTRLNGRLKRLEQVLGAAAEEAAHERCPRLVYMRRDEHGATYRFAATDLWGRPTDKPICKRRGCGARVYIGINPDDV